MMDMSSTENALLTRVFVVPDQCKVYRQAPSESPRVLQTPPCLKLRPIRRCHEQPTLSRRIQNPRGQLAVFFCFLMDAKITGHVQRLASGLLSRLWVWRGRKRKDLSDCQSLKNEHQIDRSNDWRAN